MKPSPSGLIDRLLSLAFSILAAAVMLYLAARLIVAVLPVLVGIGAVALVLFLGWSAYQFWRSHW
jgi:NADH:ubiquinone oxidoreductase subunit 6 (subunit J)